MMNIWNFIAEKLRNNQSLYLMVNIESHGSSPGKKGFKMAVSSDGSINGSIGGGIMERKLVEKAWQLIKTKEHTAFLLEQDHHPKAGKDGSGMICSGKQSIAFIPLNFEHLSSIQEIVTSVTENKPGVLQISKERLQFEARQLLSIENQLQTQAVEQWKYAEQLGLPDHLYIFGSGHVGLALSRIFSVLDFQVTIFDNREGLNTFEENIFTDHKKIIDFNKIENLIPEGENIYVVVMTFTHKNDELIIRQLLPKKIKYLGMMGSTMKVKTIFDTLRKEGFQQSLLDKIDAPIGLEIGSETPAEIAVSIAAKIISVRRDFN